MEGNDGFIDIDLFCTPDKPKNKSSPHKPNLDESTRAIDQDPSTRFDKTSFSFTVAGHSMDSSDDLFFRQSPSNVAARSSLNTTSAERPLQNSQKSAEARFNTNPSSSDHIRGLMMPAGRKRKIPGAFYESSDDEMESTLPTSFKPPRGLEHLSGSHSSGNAKLPAKTSFKKHRGSTNYITPDKSNWPAQSSPPSSSFTMVPNESSFLRRDDVETPKFFTPEPRPKQFATVSVPDQSPNETAFSTSSHKCRGFRPVRNEHALHRGRPESPAPFQLPTMPANLTSPATDPDGVIAMLHELPQILTNLHDQQNHLIRCLATRTNDQQKEIQQLKSENQAIRRHVDETFQDLATQMNRKSDVVERTCIEKMQELIDLDDEVVKQHHPVAGGAYGGPRFNKPNKEPSVFKGLLSKKG